MGRLHKFAVIGLGRFGASIVHNLVGERKVEVFAMDIDSERIKNIKQHVTVAVQLDSTDKESLLSQNITDMDAVVVSIGENFQATLLTTFVLQELGIKRLIVRASAESEMKILKKMGVAEILSPEEEVGSNVAAQLLNPSFLKNVALTSDYSIIEVHTPNTFAGRTLEEVGLRSKYRLNLITILNGSTEKLEDLEIKGGIPGPSTVLETKDILLVFGKNTDIERFIEVTS